MTKEKWITTGQLVELLGVAPQTVRNMMARGEIRSIKIGQWNRVTKSEFDRLEQMVKPPSPRVEASA